MVINKYLLYLVTSLLFIIILNIGKVPLIWNGVLVQAYIDTFMGLFAGDLIITIGVLLIGTFCILAIGLIPMRVKLW